MGEHAFSYIESIVDFGNCYACGVRMGGPASLYNKRREDHGTFYCINGHAQCYTGKTEADRLRQELEATKSRLELQRSYLVQRDRSISALRGQVTKVKNRVGNGVCPCCNRTFQNLMRHMNTKHPDYKNK